MGRLRFFTCLQPGCGELAGPRGYCIRHARPAWSGRNGATRRAAIGVPDRTWQKLRRAALARDRNWCRRCGGRATEVDHIVPAAWRRPSGVWAVHLDGLVSLCGHCHGIKSKREAVLAREHGSPPPNAVLDRHAAWWLDQLDGVRRAAL